MSVKPLVRDAQTRRMGDAGMWIDAGTRIDTETRGLEHSFRRVPISPCLHFFVSPFLRVPALPPESNLARGGIVLVGVT